MPKGDQFPIPFIICITPKHAYVKRLLSMAIKRPIYKKFFKKSKLNIFHVFSPCNYFSLPLSPRGGSGAINLSIKEHELMVDVP